MADLLGEADPGLWCCGLTGVLELELALLDMPPVLLAQVLVDSAELAPDCLEACLCWYLAVVLLRPRRGLLPLGAEAPVGPPVGEETSSPGPEPFLAGPGALEGLSSPPVVSFVWAARISGAMRAMSGRELGAEAEAELSDMRNCRSRRIEARSHGRVPPPPLAPLLLEHKCRPVIDLVGLELPSPHSLSRAARGGTLLVMTRPYPTPPSNPRLLGFFPLPSAP
jgi:hypothetical protein